MPDAQILLLDALVKAVKRRLASYGMLGTFITTAVGFGPIEDRLAGFCRNVPDSLREQFADEDERRRLEKAAEEALLALMRRNWTELTDFSNRAKVSRNVEALLADKTSANTLSRIVSCWATALMQTVRRIPIGRLDRFFGPELRHSVAALCAAECGAFARERTADLMRETRIWDVVYDSIVGYDEKKMEAVTRSVANRELRGVTLWGGVIGFGVGFFGSLLIHFLRLM